MVLKRGFLQALAACALAAALTAGCAFAAIGTGTVTASSLRLREKATTSSATLAFAPKGASVSILERLDGWYRVLYNGREGYMSADWLDVDLSSAPSGPDAQQPAPIVSGVVSAGPLNVRSGPGTGYARLGMLKEGAALTLLEDCGNGWYKISSGSLTGYVSAQYVTLDAARTDPEPDPDPGAEGGAAQAVVTAGPLNVRSGPGTGYAKIGSLKQGSFLSILEDCGNGWYRVAAGSVSGYVCGDYISAVSGGGQDDPDVGATAAALAKSLIGKRYAYGAAGPDAFDCSGLTSYIYKQLGYPIARGGSGQYNESGRFVPADEIRPGDLVFFFDPRFDSSGGTLPMTHVGIYVGDNQFVNASTVSWTVRSDQLYGSYYEPYIVGFKRIA